MEFTIEDLIRATEPEPESPQAAGQPAFVWAPCRSPIAAAEASGVVRVGSVRVRLETPLLFWPERAAWLWYKKWNLPRILVDADLTLSPHYPDHERSLAVVATCGTLVAGDTELRDEGLGGECTQRLLRTGPTQFEALTHAHTSTTHARRAWSASDDSWRTLACGEVPVPI